MMDNSVKNKKWLKPVFDFDSELPTKNRNECHEKYNLLSNQEMESKPKGALVQKIKKDWIKTFDPVVVENLAVHHKKIQEVEDWLKSILDKDSSKILLMSGPVGCGKTITLQTLCSKHKIKIAEWITPLDIELPTENGQYEFKERQSIKFLNFLINAANYTSLLDNNNNKIVVVEDFPNTFIRTPSEFTEVLEQYKLRAKSAIVFICSDSYMDTKNNALHLFTPNLKNKYNIQDVVFNSISLTGLRSALKRVADIMAKKHDTVYNTPSLELIECVANSSSGDVRSAVLNLHFAALKGSQQDLETSIIVENKTSKAKKKSNKKKPSTCKFLSIGKNETVSILHGVGRVLNPKVIDGDIRKFTHSPNDIIEQFISIPSSFVSFLEENYLPHFSNIDDTERAAKFISDADILIAEWKEKMCQEYGLYTAVAGLMLANKAPVSAWNPVRGPKNMRIQYPTSNEIPLLDMDYLYKGKVLVADFQTYCKIIATEQTSQQTEIVKL